MRVLVFNFFSGVKDRGIPVYASDIAVCLRRVGIDAVELRCPFLLRRLPDTLLNVCFVLFEQLVAPLARVLLRCAFTVYPYNSAGIIDALLDRSAIVVHDLMPNQRQQRSRLAARYISVTQRLHARLGRTVCAASEQTLAMLRRLPRFAAAELVLWSNPFYSFESAVGQAPNPRPADGNKPLRVLLCSGCGPNKDYAGALALFQASAALADAHLWIVGFGSERKLALRRVKVLPPAVAKRIHVLPRLTLDRLVREFLHCDVVWVHSKKEGFGRCVFEGRLSGRPVVASNIRAFRQLRGPGVSLYGPQNFEATMRAALDHPPDPMQEIEAASAYHRALEAEVAGVAGRFA